MNIFPELHTKRLFLRQIQAHDKVKVFEGLSHPDVIRFYGVNYKTLEETEIQMDWYKKLWEDQTGIWWAITFLNNPFEMIGALGINNWNHQHRHAEIGFWILPEYQQKGFMKEAANTVLHFLFSNTTLHRIYAQIEPENKASLTLLEKLGFITEGRQREVEWKNEKFIDLIEMSLLDFEFKSNELKSEAA